MNRAGVILVSKGAESPEFMEADRVAEAIHRRIRKVLDAPDTGQPEGNEATAVTEPVERGTGGADPHREGQLHFPRVYIEARPKVAARALRLMTMSSKTTRIMCSARSRSRTRRSSGQGRTATHRWSRACGIGTTRSGRTFGARRRWRKRGQRIGRAESQECRAMG